MMRLTHEMAGQRKKTIMNGSRGRVDWNSHCTVGRAPWTGEDDGRPWGPFQRSCLSTPPSCVPWFRVVGCVIVRESDLVCFIAQKLAKFMIFQFYHPYYLKIVDIYTILPFLVTRKNFQMSISIQGMANARHTYQHSFLKIGRRWVQSCNFAMWTVPLAALKVELAELLSTLSST